MPTDFIGAGELQKRLKKRVAEAMEKKLPEKVASACAHFFDQHGKGRQDLGVEIQAEWFVQSSYCASCHDRRIVVPLDQMAIARLELSDDTTEGSDS